MELNFYLNDIEIEEPIGFGGIELSIIRDEEFHGIGFEASTGTLEFHGNGADILRAAKETSGIAANVIFRAEVICNAYQEEENIYTGRVNFGMYSEKCGDSCTVSVGVEEDSCIVTLRNRMDQKVDVDSLVAFDKQTALADYVMMGEEITLPAVELDARTEGYTPVGGEVVQEEVFGPEPFMTIQVRPTYTEFFNSLNNGQLVPGANTSVATASIDLPMSPVFLNEEPPNCIAGTFNVEGRLKGSYLVGSAPDDIGLRLYVYFYLWDGTSLFSPFLSGALAVDILLEVQHDLPDTHTGVFDLSYSNPALDIPYGYSLYAIFEARALSEDEEPVTLAVQVTWDEETFIKIFTSKLCPTTETESYLIHETLSRVTESITNSCARVKSEYFGRTESEPFAFPEDGCGGLRFLTSGLKIRKAEKDYFFASFQQLIDGLNAIDNIGFGIEDDPVLPNKKVVRIENVGYFYQDSILLTLPSIPRAQSDIKEDMYYSLIKIGYKRWEIEQINGLDEFNSTREYRTSFDVVNKTLEIESELVSGSYPIEKTRQQSFNSTGAADTTYDNEIFIVCVQRQGYNTFAVEVDSIEVSTDLYSPATKYNVRISPARNMLRWYKSTANGYVNISDTSNKIFFGSGTGNIAACIKMLNNAYVDDCVNEDSVLCENQDIHIGDFLDQANGAPIWKNETLAFEYPLSISDYRTIKAAPYGKIRYQCGQGEFEEGYIKEVKFRPIDGTASFTLIKKY